MDGSRFDAMTRSLTGSGSRRRALTLGLSGALASLLRPDNAEAHDLSAKCKKLKGAKKKKCLKKAKKHAAQDAANAAPPPSPGCPAGERSCPGRGGCIAATQCCTNADCAPVGTCDLATGTCACNTAALRTCPDAPGTCVQCCNDEQCPNSAECRDRACRCPSTTPNGPCGCSEAFSNPPIACGSGLSCFCYIDMSTGTSAQCGRFQSGDPCSPAAPCDPNEFCGAKNFTPAQGGVCTTTCTA